MMRLAVSGSLVLLVGCAALSGPSAALRPTWPGAAPAATPFDASKAAQLPADPPRTGAREDEFPTPVRPTPSPREQESLERAAHEAPLPPESGPALLAPQIIPRRAQSHLELSVEVPLQTQVGGDVVYQLRIENTSDQIVRNVAIECQFDAPLTFPGTDDKLARQELGDLTPGEVRTSALTLIGEKTGRHCCEFSLTADGVESVWKSVCVEFVPKRLDVRLLGPAQRAVGTRGEYVLNIINVAREELTDVLAVVDFDPALAAREATEGVAQAPGRLEWSLGRLKPGEAVSLEMEFECLRQTSRSCISAQVMVGDELGGRAETCVEIAPATAGLRMQVFDRADPIEVGDQTAFVVIIDNRSSQPVRHIRLETELPRSVRMLTAEVRDSGGIIGLRHQLKGNTVVFEPINRLDPATSLTYLVQVKALEPARAEFTARLRSELSEEPITASEPTTIRGGR